MAQTTHVMKNFDFTSGFGGMDFVPLSSWTPCDTCGSTSGSERHTVYDRGNATLLEVCTDCPLYISYPHEHRKPEGF